MTVPDVPQWLRDDVSAVILAAVDRRAEEVTDRLQHISDEGGAEAMFSACVAWADAASRMAGFHDAIAASTADGVALGTLDGTPIDERAPATFAARFVVAVTNRQVDTAHALFGATLDDPEHHQWCVAELVAMVGSLGRAKIAEARAGRARRAHHHRPPKQRRRRR